MKTEIIEQNWKGLQSLTPDTLGQAMQIAEILSKTSFAQAFKTKEDIFIAVMVGKDLGFSPMQSLQSLAIINGKATLWGDALLAICQAHPEWNGMVESFDKDAKSAICTAKRKGKPDITEEFSIEDARTAGLLGKQGPWKNYPKRMCRMRSRSWALRAQFADALRGLQCSEEVNDYVVKGVIDHSERPPDPIFTNTQPPIENGNLDSPAKVATTATEKAVTKPVDSGSPKKTEKQPTPQQKKNIKRLELILAGATLSDEEVQEVVNQFTGDYGVPSGWASQVLHDFEALVCVPVEVDDELPWTEVANES